jgi:hypothetical protein
VRKSVDDTGHGLAEHDDDQQPEAFDQCVGDGERCGLDRGGGGDDCREPGQVGEARQAPCQHPVSIWQYGRDGQHAGAQCGPDHVEKASAAVFGPVAACGKEPESGQQGEEHGCGGGEGSSPCAARFGDEGAEWYERQDLQQEQGSAACVVSPVQFVMERAVEPRDPYQGEHRGELPQPRRVEVVGQVTCGLRDQNDDNQVVEQFQRADDTLTGLFAVGARGLPKLAA